MKLAQNSFTVRGSENWNLLPHEIRNEKKTKTFKTLAKSGFLKMHHDILPKWKGGVGIFVNRKVTQYVIIW